MKTNGRFFLIFFFFFFHFFFFFFFHFFFFFSFSLNNSIPTSPLASTLHGIGHRECVLNELSSQFLEGRLRVFGENTDFHRPKHTVAKHHLQLNGQSGGHLKESDLFQSSLIVLAFSFSFLIWSRSSQRKITRAKNLADEGVPKMRQLSQLLTSGKQGQLQRPQAAQLSQGPSPFRFMWSSFSSWLARVP